MEKYSSNIIENKVIIAENNTFTMNNELYLLPIQENNKDILKMNKKEEKSLANKKNKNFHLSYFQLFPSFFNYWIYYIRKNDNKDKKFNTIKVYNFYLKKRFKYNQHLKMYKNNKIKYLIHYLVKLTKKFVVKDLKDILIEKVFMNLLENVSFLLYKMVKKGKNTKKNKEN